MGAETKRAGEQLAVGVVVGVLHLAVVSERFTTPQGGGGVTLLLGCVFTTGLLWTMLALRTVAADGRVAPEIDDGLTSMAVTVWVMALLPPRASNFLDQGGTDDFAWVYVPVCLLAVFVVLAAQKLWPAREERWMWTRLFAGVSACAVAVSGCVFFISKGEGAEAVAVRGLVLGALAAAATVLSTRRRR